MQLIRKSTTERAFRKTPPLRHVRQYDLVCKRLLKLMCASLHNGFEVAEALTAEQLAQPTQQPRRATQPGAQPPLPLSPCKRVGNVDGRASQRNREVDVDDPDEDGGPELILLSSSSSENGSGATTPMFGSEITAFASPPTHTATCPVFVLDHRHQEVDRLQLAEASGVVDVINGLEDHFNLKDLERIVSIEQVQPDGRIRSIRETVEMEPDQPVFVQLYIGEVSVFTLVVFIVLSEFRARSARRRSP